MTSSDFGCMLSVGAIRFEDMFCASKKGGLGGGGRAYSRHAVHMVAALAGYRTALVGTARTFLTLLAQMGAETTPRGTISRSVGSF